MLVIVRDLKLVFAYMEMMWITTQQKLSVDVSIYMGDKYCIEVVLCCLEAFAMRWDWNGLNE